MSKLLFDKPSYSHFKQKLSENLRYKDGDELEIRFGNFHRVADKYDFHPGVSAKDFYRLMNVLKTNENKNYKYITTTKTKVKYYNDNYRVIENLDETNNVISSRLEKKDKKGKADIISLEPYSIRFALSSERSVPLSKLSDLTYQSFKLQTRYIFEHTDNNYQLHLSVINKKNEITYELEIESKRNFLMREENYIPVLKSIFSLMTDKFSVCSKKLVYKFRETYEKVVKTLHQTSSSKLRYDTQNYTIDNKPVSVYYNNAYSLRSGYAISNKLDGVYYNLVIAPFGVALVNTTEIQLLLNEEEVKKLLQNTNLSETTILVGELYNKGFYVFDAVVVNGEDVYTRNYTDRLRHRLLPEIYKNFTSITKIPIKNKLVKNSGEIIEDIKSILSESQTYYNQTKKFEDFNDGIIFTKIDEPYYETSYKWKFPERISIDGKIKLLTELSDSSEKTFEVKFKKFQNTLDTIQDNEHLIISKADPFFDLLRNDMIVELGWKDDAFIVERIRDDKILPNAIRTAETTLAQMKNPMTLEELFKVIKNGPSLEQELPINQSEERNQRYRKFCNLIKTYLISRYCKKDSNVLDLGAGVGGDLYKYENAMPEKLYLVEPYLFSGLQSRVKELNNAEFKSRIEMINTHAENLNVIKSVVGNTKISLINMMFSMMFFGKEDVLNKLMQTLNILENDGVFVTAYMDGEKTLEKLRANKGLFKGSFFEIKDLMGALTSDPTYRLKFGHRIYVSIRGKSITSEGQEEYLLPALQFKNKASLIGLKLSSTLSFDLLSHLVNPSKEIRDALELYNQMSEEEKELLSLFRFDVYEKRGYKEQQLIQSQMQNALTSLQPKLREVINLSFQQPDEKFTRIGVIGDGSCFFYALVQALELKDFYQMESQEQRKLISLIRTELAENFKPNQYTALQDGELAVYNMDMRIASILEKREKEYEKFVEAKKTIARDQNYFKNYYNAIKNLNFPGVNVKSIFELCYMQYKKELQSDWIRADHLEYISEIFNINTFIVTDLSLDVYLGVGLKYNPDYNSVIILNLDGRYSNVQPHYETIVRSLKGKTSSVFTDKEEIVQRLLQRSIKPTEQIETDVVERVEDTSLDILQNNIEEIIRRNFSIRNTNLVCEVLEFKKEEEEEIEIPEFIINKQQYAKNVKEIESKYGKEILYEMPFGIIEKFDTLDKDEQRYYVGKISYFLKRREPVQEKEEEMEFEITDEE